ncbi:hypothetical protein [Streptomyces lydicus]|uniref:Uncharacterized protein n=1 Tax=Streptomyces lydicus TaxID=47763 RepID=A0A1D7VM49_9ACTN|nr:hypothetical protein [Streptomyces lydicus]AOP47802.1 hypothetical protein SL103_17500 [Streptomyces lydicus]
MNQFDIAFGEAVERLCTSCRWALFTDSPILPLGAAVNDVDSLTIWLDRDPEDEDDVKAERDAAIVLSTGDYPLHTSDVGDADEEDNEAGHDTGRGNPQRQGPADPSRPAVGEAGLA